MGARISLACNNVTPAQSGAEIANVLNSMLADLTALTASFNQLRTDYNANATIATDTTAAAVTLGTTA